MFLMGKKKLRILLLMHQRKLLKKYKNVLVEDGDKGGSLMDDELIKDLIQQDLYKYVKVINNPEVYVNLINQNFEFSGTKIDWSQTYKHYYKESDDESLLTDAIQFINELKEKYLTNNIQVIYIGDGLTEYGYQFALNDIEKLLVCFLDFPQHHYFIPLNCDWCICITKQNDLDFGYSLKKS